MKIFFVLLAFALAACADSGRNSASDYAERVASVLDLNLPTYSEPNLNFPSSSQLVVNYPRQELSIREFMSMRQCKLHTIIANKNSQMGKVAPASQVLFVDLQTLANGPECLDQLKRDEQLSLANKLERYLNSKEMLIDQVMWQAILGSTENAKFWSRSRRIDNYPNEVTVDPLPSIESLLGFIKDVQNKHYSISPNREIEIENSLRTLSYADGGLLLQSMSKINKGLGSADQLIQRALDRPTCFNQRPNQKSQYLKNVMLTYFIGQVQPDLVALLQRYRQLMPLYFQLEELLSATAPPAYQQWQLHRQHVFEQTQTSAKRHVLKLQQILDQCGTQLN